ncbi:MAG TPA: hypothetical protein DCL80_03540 [Balneola sp.]|jgi:hypothetical protein|nr:hypothetical protein [Balneola sp.]MAO77149.1 hypothetical protein [Balneola sp.]MBF63402.1 hypothetical protein [Balneola sp.]HAH50368.1 hypothetical protein [Balneola sp.]HAW79449.1 hypothetical protein [Balneola sp.]|tara:strand:+ start:11441 stop:12148 length:708 start_codon:yes stop_codon:yes gene_type:complete
MIVTIHQPDFMPWFGFFNKINRADKWVLLDHTENNPREAAFWGRRVKILINGEPQWLSITLDKPKEKGVVGIPINEMTINTQNPKLLSKNRKTIHLAYKKAPYFEQFVYLIDNYFDSNELSMMKRNMAFITEVMNVLGINTEIVKSSSMEIDSSSTQLLVDIVKHENGNSYLCGTGAGGYQDDALFEKNNIELLYNEFNHPEYEQLRSDVFHPGLSIIDMLFMKGDEFIKEKLNS